MKYFVLPALLFLSACGITPDSSGILEINDPPVEDQNILARFTNSSNSFVRSAMQIREETLQNNNDDLNTLLNELAQNFAPKHDQSQLLATTAARLNADRQRFLSVKSRLDLGTTPDERGSAPLRTSLDKLTGKNGVTGILDDAVQMLAQRGTELVRGSLGSFKPEHNQITVLKTALIYLLATRSQIDGLPDVTRDLRLLYPATLPENFDTIADELNESPLFTADPAPMLRVPNAGYIYGGDFQGVTGELLQGIDCSAFLSRITGSTARLSTMVMEYAWRIQQNDDFSTDDPDGTIRSDLATNWGLDSAIDQFAALPSIDTIAPGTLVIWRSPAGPVHTSGHVVMALERPDSKSGRFYAIEATRSDNKLIEGIVVRHLLLNLDNTDTYLLRRR